MRFLSRPPRKICAVLERAALFTDPCVKLTAGRTRCEVGVALIPGGPNDRPFEAYLPAELIPMEHASGVCIVLKLEAFSGLVVTVECGVAFDSCQLL